MATYYSYMLNRAISYDKNLITPKEIQEIINFIFENDCSKYSSEGINVYKWVPKQKTYIFHTHWCWLNKKQKYYIRMQERIKEMFDKAQIGEK